MSAKFVQIAMNLAVITKTLSLADDGWWEIATDVIWGGKNVERANLI